MKNLLILCVLCIALATPAFAQSYSRCPDCGHFFETSHIRVSTAAATAAGAAAGGWIGSSMGIALGPLGAISGCVPGAIVGGFMGFFTADMFTQCPKCNKIFRR